MWPGWGVGKGKSTRGFGDGDGPEGEVREQLDIDAHEKGLGAAATENIGLRSHSDNGVAAPEAERKRLLRTRCDSRAGLVQLRRRAAGDKCDDKERLQHFVRVGEPIEGRRLSGGRRDEVCNNEVCNDIKSHRQRKCSGRRQTICSCLDMSARV